MSELRDIRNQLSEIEAHFARVERGAKAALVLLYRGRDVVRECDAAGNVEHAEWMQARYNTLVREVSQYEMLRVDRDQLWMEICEALGIEFTIEP